ncbi:MAG: prepilin-type N-terminal cleavage/methylation domain-containing protein [Polyangiaceae bacterium]|nr:prepilin-type N-terminal cleavage/methylation domain-containing protein [Polyangiaceae bacterium]
MDLTLNNKRTSQKVQSPSEPAFVLIQGARTKKKTRGVTLIEVLITLAIVGVIAGIGILGVGAQKSARMRGGAVVIAGAIRTAYSHSSGVSKPLRLVFDMTEQQVILEESNEAMTITKNDRTGGAAAATDAERAAHEESEAILKGPRPPRPSFSPTKAFGFAPDKGKTGKDLPLSVRFVHVETDHDSEPVSEERAYLYFWPGGQTERAAIVVTTASKEEEPTDQNSMTVLVSPLTGKTEIKKGIIKIARPKDEREESERDDSGF